MTTEPTTASPIASPTASPTTWPSAPAGPRTATRRRPAVGRDALCDAVRSHLAGGGGVLLTGPAGIGRTTVVSRLSAELSACGYQVLSCSPSPSERDSPYLGLIDLLAGVPDSTLAELGSHERAVLEGALLRRTPPEGIDPTGGRDALVLRIAVRKLLTLLGGERPLLLAVDDAQWLDTPTAQTLGFLAGRAGHAGHAGRTGCAAGAGRGGPGPAVLVALRTGPRTGPPSYEGYQAYAAHDAAERYEADAPQEWCPQPVRRVPMPPMTAREVAELLDGHDEPPWPKPLLTRLHQAGGGNPRTVLELSSALTERVRLAGGALPDSTEPLPVPDSLRRPVLDRIAALLPSARQTLVTASAAARPTVELLMRAGGRQTPADIDTCVRHGLLQASDHGLISFPDPLTPMVLQAETPYGLRADAHRALAEATDDPVERAHHLGRLTAGPDSAVAARLVDAATAARRRGAPGTAARLGRLAARCTPTDETHVDTDRRLTAAEDGLEAGDFDFARQLAYEVLGDADRPADRVRAWNVVVDSCGQAMAEIADVFPAAVHDAGRDPALLAQLHYRMSWREWMVGGSAARAHGYAVRAAGLAGQAGDRRTELLALTQQAALELFLGLPEAETTLATALTAPHDVHAMAHHNGPIYLKHRFHLVHDRLDEARTELRTLVYTLRQRGSAESLSQCLIGLAQVEIERGRCRQALTVARQSLRIAEQAGLSQGPAWYAVSLAETAGGTLGRALAAAETARQHSEDDDDRLFLPRALHAEGRILLFGGESARAAELLRRTGEMETAQGQQDPATRRWHADLAEALARSGATDEATAVITRARAQAVRLGRPGVVATLDRSAAAVNEARGELALAAAGFEDAAARLRAARYPLEEARTRLALGRVLRRTGDDAAAHAAFAEALRIFTRADARAWVSLARAERDRAENGAVLLPEGAWTERLTSTERSVVARVAQGATNREVAAGLVLSVKTVEAALTRAYRKLGAKSRVEITRIVMARPTA
ncbi:AAA family ATPase [Streptomyces sp. NBC_01387]|uniref:AAA family ATPase n=1 Tax=unclassified Streptomyces TaxID=2593676 RepID=UPI002DDB7CEF|nr:AAA family ATPase [Streptomyces sp. NBC_01766]WSC19832.1 AAA family ATPase [Streptomyces sp. NBC_01766]